MRGATIALAILLGLSWNAIAVLLMGGSWTDTLEPSLLLAGATAGIAAARFTIWSRRRREGQEGLLAGIATYYIGMVVYWAVFVIAERIIRCIEQGGWTGFNLEDQLGLIGLFLVYGTLWYGIILIPLTFLSRYLLWWVYTLSLDRRRR